MKQNFSHLLFIHDEYNYPIIIVSLVSNLCRQSVFIITIFFFVLITGSRSPRSEEEEEKMEVVCSCCKMNKGVLVI